MAGPTCGITGSISVDGENQTYAHKVSVSATATESTTRVFGGKKYGTRSACIAEGEISMDTYEYIDGLVVGNTADVVANMGGQVTITSNAATLLDMSDEMSADETNIVWTYLFKFNNTVSGM